MDASIGIYLVLIFGALIALGVPIAISIGVSSVIILISTMPFTVAVSTAGQKMVTGIDSFSLLAVPLFILAGNIMNHGGIANRLIRFAYIFVGRIPGAVSHVNIVANMLFGSVSGSAVAAVAAVGKTLLPQVQKNGMDVSLFTAANIASGPTGQIIPPSNGMIVYSVVSGGTSIGALFLAGYIPGILMGLASMIVVAIYLKINPALAGDRVVVKFTFKETCQIIWQAFPSLALIIVIIGGIIAGIYTATEAACAAVVYALILSVIYKQIDLKTLKFIAKDTIEISSLVLFLIGASSAMSYVLAYTQLPKLISDTILGITTNEIVILLIINIVLLIVGMFMDATAAIFILVPILLPVMVKIGVSPLFFVVFLVITLSFGLITPPVGVCLYAAQNVTGMSFEAVVKSVMPWLYLTTGVLVMFIFFPEIITAPVEWMFSTN